MPVIVAQFISIEPFAARDKKKSKYYTLNRRMLDDQCEFTVMAYLHQASTSTLRQCCDYARDIALIENNGVDPNCNPFWDESIVFNQNSIASDDADAQYKRTLNAGKVGES